MSEEEIPSLGGGCGIQRTFLEEVIPSRSPNMSNNSQEEAEEAECEFQAEGTVCKAVSTYSQPFQGTESKIWLELRVEGEEAKRWSCRSKAGSDHEVLVSPRYAPPVPGTSTSINWGAFWKCRLSGPTPRFAESESVLRLRKAGLFMELLSWGIQEKIFFFFFTGRDYKVFCYLYPSR